MPLYSKSVKSGKYRVAFVRFIVCDPQLCFICLALSLCFVNVSSSLYIALSFGRNGGVQVIRALPTLSSPVCLSLDVNGSIST